MVFFQNLAHYIELEKKNNPVKLAKDELKEILINRLQLKQETFISLLLFYIPIFLARE